MLSTRLAGAESFLRLAAAQVGVALQDGTTRMDCKADCKRCSQRALSKRAAWHRICWLAAETTSDRSLETQ